MEENDLSSKFKYKGITYSIGTYKSNLVANIEYRDLDNSQINLFEMIYDAYSNFLAYFNK